MLKFTYLMLFSILPFSLRSEEERGQSINAALLSEINTLWQKDTRALVQTFNEKNLADVWLASAAAGRLDVLDLLIKKGKAGSELLDRFGNNMWLIAAAEGHTAVLAWLLDHDIEGVLNKNDRSANIWLITASRGHLDTLKWLQGNNIAHQDHRDKEGNTIWHRAILVKEDKPRLLDWLSAEKMPGQEYLLSDLKSILPLIIDQEAINSLQWLFAKNLLSARALARLIPDIWKKAALIRDEQANEQFLELLEAKKVPGRHVLTKHLKEILPSALSFGAVGTLTWLFKHKVINKYELVALMPAIWEKAATAGNGHNRVFLEFFEQKKVPGRAAFIKAIPKLLPELLFVGATDVLQWLLDAKLLSKEKLHRIAPTIWLDLAQSDIEYAPVEMVKWLIKNEVPGAGYIDKKGNNIWLLSGAYIDIADILVLLLEHQIPGSEQVNKAGKNVWLNAAEATSLKALKLLHKHQIPGIDHVDKAGNNIWHFARIAQKADQLLEWLSTHAKSGS